MLRRALIAASILLCASAPAKEKEAGEAVGQWVDLAPVALPVVADGRVVNYVFVYVRINLARTADAPRLREKEPYFRDALVRAGHRTPFTVPWDFTQLDTARLAASVKRDAVALAGARNIAGVTILRQTSKRRSGLPRPAPRPS